MRAVQRHTVQINLAFWPQLPTFELAKRFVIHLQGRLSDVIVNGGGQIVRRAT
jgi:hypothetical protein